MHKSFKLYTKRLFIQKSEENKYFPYKYLFCEFVSLGRALWCTVVWIDFSLYLSLSLFAFPRTLSNREKERNENNKKAIVAADSCVMFLGVRGYLSMHLLNGHTMAHYSSPQHTHTDTPFSQ